VDGIGGFPSSKGGKIKPNSEQGEPVVNRPTTKKKTDINRYKQF